MQKNIPNSVYLSQKGYEPKKALFAALKTENYLPLPEKQVLESRGVKKIRPMHTEHHFPEPRDHAYGLWIHRNAAPTLPEPEPVNKYGIHPYRL